MGRSAGIGLPATASLMAGSTSSSASLSEAYEISDASSPSSDERESRLLNPPPGSTDPERFATVSIGIGDRVLFHPAPREPRHESVLLAARKTLGIFSDKVTN